MQQVREFTPSHFGPQYLPEQPNACKSTKEPQEAHEANRPTHVCRAPGAVEKFLPPDEMKVYPLIWQRFVASQMMQAVFDQTSVDIEARSDDKRYMFRVTGSVLKFDGFLKVYEEAKDAKDE